MQKIIAQIAQEIRVHVNQIEAAVALLDGGATVPFIARYRKEVTGGLDDIQLRELEARLSYLRELEERRGAVRVSSCSTHPMSSKGSCTSRSVPPQGKPKRAASSLVTP